MKNIDPKKQLEDVSRLCRLKLIVAGGAEAVGRLVVNSLRWGLSRRRLLLFNRSVNKRVALGAVGVLGILLFTSLTVPNNQIVVYDGDEVFYFYTPYTTIDEILQDGNLMLGEDDNYVFTGINDGKQGSLLIRRAFVATIDADQQQTSLVATQGTVADILKRANIDHSEDDIITPELTKQPRSDVTITLQRVTFEEIKEIVPVPFESKRPSEKPKNRIPQIVQAGEKGEQTMIQRVKHIDGVKTETTLLSEEITKQPVNEVTQYVKDLGIGVSELIHDSSDVLLDENGIPINYKHKVTGKATAYSALGKPTKLVPGCVAMDLSKYPKGTKLYIRASDGSYIYGYSKVADTGSFVHNGSGVLVDLFFNSYAESVRFGAMTVDVYVLE